WCSILVVALVPFAIEALSALKTGTFMWPTATDNINLGYLNYSLLSWLRVLTLTQVFAPTHTLGGLQFKFTTINAVYWTLAIECQFYLVMAIAVWFRVRAVLWIALVTAVSVPI